MFKFNFKWPVHFTPVNCKPVVCWDFSKDFCGTKDNDWLCGQKDDDCIRGDDGNDSIETGGGCDVVYGNQGDDCVLCDNDSTIFGGAGNDTIYVSDGATVVYGNAGDDAVYVNTDCCSELFGGSGNDTLIGGDGADSIFGGRDNDLIDGQGANDYLLGGSGYDTISGGEGDDTLFGGSENDQLYGGAGNDLMYGGKDQDYLAGGAGNDTLVGDKGCDTLVGGDGNDREYGGSGNDIMYGGAGDDTLSGGQNEGSICFRDGPDTPAPDVTVETTCNTFCGSSWDFAAKGVTVTAYDANLCAAATPIGDHSNTTTLGVEGRTVVDAGKYEIGYNPTNLRSEQINFKTQDIISHAEFKLGAFYGNGDGRYAGVYEQGQWVAYDNGNHYVASGTFVANTTGNYTLKLDFADAQNVHSISLSALDYASDANGGAWTRTDSANADCLYNDSSDFDISSVSICTDVIRVKQSEQVEADCRGSTITSLCVGDRLFGGAGADTFNYNYGNGVQEFVDFNASEGDHIRLLGFNASELKAALIDAEQGGHEDVLILGTNMALVNGTGDWHASDFIIG